MLNTKRFLRVRHRNSSGSIAESGAALAILIPIFIIALFVAIEAAQFFMINAALNLCATTAARNLAIKYGTNPTGTMANPETVFSDIKFLNMVVSEQQFEIPQGGWNFNSKPQTVTVIVNFESGKNGCPTFPNPDPLGLGNKVKLSASATYRLE